MPKEFEQVLSSRGGALGLRRRRHRRWRGLRACIAQHHIDRKIELALLGSLRVFFVFFLFFLGASLAIGAGAFGRGRSVVFGRRRARTIGHRFRFAESVAVLRFALLRLEAALLLLLEALLQFG